MKKPLILIGFMGAGKTTVGKLLSRELALPFLDTDQYIETSEKRTISQIFDEDGEAYFREVETSAIRRLKESGVSAVISCGGGMPLREENRLLLQELGTVIYLRVQPKTVIRRLKGDTTRPLLQGEDAAEKVYRLMQEREERYSMAASLVIDTDGLSAGQVAAKILEELQG